MSPLHDNEVHHNVQTTLLRLHKNCIKMHLFLFYLLLVLLLFLHLYILLFFYFLCLHFYLEHFFLFYYIHLPYCQVLRVLVESSSTTISTPPSLLGILLCPNHCNFHIIPLLLFILLPLFYYF